MNRVNQNRHNLQILTLFAFLFLVHCQPYHKVEKEPEDPLQDQFALWASIKEPLPGQPEAIGNYTAGCLIGAQALELSGPGFAVMRPSRNRYYGHPKTINFIKNLAQKLQEKKLPTLLIGDISPPRGGPMLAGHASHQLGLDADLWLTMPANPPSREQQDSWTMKSVVDFSKMKLNSNWTENQEKLIATVAEDPVVERIFVHPVIKQHFCKQKKKEKWLYKLRPWYGHDAHIHVRLDCPEDSPTCQSQPKLSTANDGCKDNLRTWIAKAKEAHRWSQAQRASKSSKVRRKRFPKLPTACQSLPSL